MDTKSDFELFWRYRLSGIAPMGHKLRSAFADRWLRLHGLPNSKRLPSNAGDADEIVARANAIGSELFAPDEQLWMIGLVWGEAEAWRPWRDPHVYQYGLEYVGRVIEDDGVPEEPNWVGIYAAKADWRPGQFDLAFNMIADDFVRCIWSSLDGSRTLAPYDGGFDVFVPTPEDVQNVRARFKDWLPDGEL